MIKVKVEAEGVTIERELTDAQWAQVKDIMTKRKINTGNVYTVGASGGAGGGKSNMPPCTVIYGGGSQYGPPIGTWLNKSSVSYADFRAAGWTDEDLIRHGYIEP